MRLWHSVKNEWNARSEEGTAHVEGLFLLVHEEAHDPWRQGSIERDPARVLDRLGKGRVARQGERPHLGAGIKGAAGHAGIEVGQPLVALVRFGSTEPLPVDQLDVDGHRRRVTVEGRRAGLGEGHRRRRAPARASHGRRLLAAVSMVLLLLLWWTTASSVWG